jgi:hypothetical protein
MSEINDGGPAFPVSTGDPTASYQDGPYTSQYPGMTLRDYFAAKAMVMKFGETGTSITVDDMAVRCYAMADAMLRARGGAA